MPLWPGTGASTETGSHDNVLNVPFAPETDGTTMRSVYTQIVFPRLRDFVPELILVSAGFDAHRDDPLAELNWNTEDFQWLGRKLCAVAREICQGRLVSVLEGGYDLRALAASAKVFVNELIEAPNE